MIESSTAANKWTLCCDCFSSVSKDTNGIWSSDLSEVTNCQRWYLQGSVILTNLTGSTSTWWKERLTSTLCCWETMQKNQESLVSKLYFLICLWFVISCIGLVKPLGREHQRPWVYELLSILISIRDMLYSLKAWRTRPWINASQLEHAVNESLAIMSPSYESTMGI